MSIFRSAVLLAAFAGSVHAQYTPYQQTQAMPAPPMQQGIPNPMGGLQPTPSPAPGYAEFDHSHPMAPGANDALWCGGNQIGGCNGPVGANGPITYEIYLRTGPSILAGANAFNNVIKTGWTVQGGGRTLLFNTERDAAWVLDVGLGYTRNDGNDLNNLVMVAPSQIKNGLVGDDVPRPFGVRFLNRTSLNYGLGRDWFLNGPGAVGEEAFGNWRFGLDVGGRYGTASVGFINPVSPDAPLRKQKVYQGVYAGGGMSWEKNLGATTLFAGLRAEWSYTWLNILPPNNADIKDVNILLFAGVRF